MKFLHGIRTQMGIKDKKILAYTHTMLYKKEEKPANPSL